MVKRPELLKSLIIAMGIFVILVPVAMILGSGHFGTGVVAQLAELFLLPMTSIWKIVEPKSGAIIGDIAMVIVQYLTILMLVSIARKILRKNR